MPQKKLRNIQKLYKITSSSIDNKNDHGTNNYYANFYYFFKPYYGNSGVVTMKNGKKTPWPHPLFNSRFKSIFTPIIWHNNYLKKKKNRKDLEFCFVLSLYRYIPTHVVVLWFTFLTHTYMLLILVPTN